jgi:hypothetical protein
MHAFETKSYGRYHTDCRHHNNIIVAKYQQAGDNIMVMAGNEQKELTVIVYNLQNLPSRSLF